MLDIIIYTSMIMMRHLTLAVNIKISPVYLAYLLFKFSMNSEGKLGLSNNHFLTLRPSVELIANRDSLQVNE